MIGRSLGLAIANALNVLDLTTVVLSGYLAPIADELEPVIRETVERHALAAEAGPVLIERSDGHARIRPCGARRERRCSRCSTLRGRGSPGCRRLPLDELGLQLEGVSEEPRVRGQRQQALDRHLPHREQGLAHRGELRVGPLRDHRVVEADDAEVLGDIDAVLASVTQRTDCQGVGNGEDRCRWLGQTQQSFRPALTILVGEAAVLDRVESDSDPTDPRAEW